MHVAKVPTMCTLQRFRQCARCKGSDNVHVVKVPTENVFMFY